MAFRDALKKYRESQGTQTSTPKTTQPTSGTSGSGGFRDSLNRYRESQATISLKGWAEGSINIIDDIQKNSGNWHDESEYNSRYERINSLLAKADDWRKQYAGNEQAISYIDSVVDALNTAKSYSFGNRQFFSNFDTDEEYNLWFKKESFISKYLEDPDTATSTLDFEDSWLEEAQIRAEKNRILGAEDFQDHSKYVGTQLDNWWDIAWSQYSMGYGDLTYEYINNQNGIREDITSKSIAYRADTKDGKSSFDRRKR